eukprot:TRINITY_DN18077_c0_g1_i2.p1 TRINITY_DN18077_c0_g1~~TRINITY_DN18077_c0_g1_i2.p1  ORF type:complete len:165 (-),score=41.91 TRINITY_DN18077_c0_g1_i2:14-508(-)
MAIMTFKLKIRQELPAASSLGRMDTAMLEHKTWLECASLATAAAAGQTKFGFAPAVDGSSVLEREIGAAAGAQYRTGGIGACAAGDLEGVLRHLERGWEPGKMVDKNGSTALMWAAGGGHVQVCELLMTHGMDLEAVNKKGCLLYTSDAADEEDSVDIGGPRDL